MTLDKMYEEYGRVEFGRGGFEKSELWQVSSMESDQINHWWQSLAPGALRSRLLDPPPRGGNV